MHPVEYAMWEHYIARNGTPFQNIERLLARICSLLYNAHRDPKKAQPQSELHFAPWLETDAQRAEREERKQMAHLNMIVESARAGNIVSEDDEPDAIM